MACERRSCSEAVRYAPNKEAQHTPDSLHAPDPGIGNQLITPIKVLDDDGSTGELQRLQGDVEDREPRDSDRFDQRRLQLSKWWLLEQADK